MRVRNILCVTGLAFSIFSAQVHAATITYSGSGEGAQVNDWRTAATAKSLDIDGNDIYGSLGAMNPSYAPAGQQSGGSTTLGWSFGGSGGVEFTVGTYTSVDDIFTPSTNVSAGISTNWDTQEGWFIFGLTGTAADYAGKKVRVGIMQDVMSSGEWGIDFGKSLQITQTVGGTGDSGAVSVRSGGTGDGAPEMYFFDITDAASGDQFRIDAAHTAGGLAGYIGPVSWDIATVPEPSTLVLLGSGLIGLLAYAWRKQR